MEEKRQPNKKNGADKIFVTTFAFAKIAPTLRGNLAAHFGVRAMTMEIRQATQADANHLAELCMCVQALHVEIQPALFRKPRHADLVDFFRDRLSAPDFTSFLAMDGRIIRIPVEIILKGEELCN